MRVGPTPAFAVWPDFCAPDWKNNYALSAWPSDTNVLAAPLLASGEELWAYEDLEVIFGKPLASGKVLYLTSPSRDKVGSARAWAPPKAAVVRDSELRIWPLERPAIGFVIYVKHKKPGGGETQRCAGVVLRADMREPTYPAVSPQTSDGM